MVPRALWTLLGAAGALTAAVGALLLTLLAPDDAVGGTTLPGGLLVTAPGVAALTGERLAVRAAGDGPVFVGVARQEDLDAWVADAPHEEVRGITGDRALDVRPRPGGGSVADPAASDVWVESATGEGGAELELASPRPEWRVAVTGAREVALRWERPARHPAAWPLVVGGVLAVVVAGRSLVRANRRRAAARRPVAWVAQR